MGSCTKCGCDLLMGSGRCLTCVKKAGLPNNPKIYMASKVKHAHLWKSLRSEGYNIISTWIDETEENSTVDYVELSERCIAEITEADVTLLYVESEDVPIGALIEAGAALAVGKRVHLVGECTSVNKVFRKHPNWFEFDNIESAIS